MHNWPDTICEGILARIKEAMKPGDSMLLLYELIIRQVGAYCEATGLHMMAMALCGPEERTTKAWHDLIEPGPA
ncbi:hypothetical protein J3459_016603 [Metarhizium acridum]|nr:hypothetical protein J3459_016603 [Metarhizium acridum]